MCYYASSSRLSTLDCSLICQQSVFQESNNRHEPLRSIRLLSLVRSYDSTAGRNHPAHRPDRGEASETVPPHRPASGLWGVEGEGCGGLGRWHKHTEYEVRYDGI